MTFMKSEKIGEAFDDLYEFEREPVSEDRLESARHFAAVFAGEHVAGTEFVIGAVFVSWGVGARDLLLGLLLGNLLAVLSWTFICAPIAVQTRLTLYWYLRKIAGPGVTAVFNVLNAVLFCILGGTMITVSASAIRIPFGIAPQTLWYPQDLRFVLVVLCVGAVVVTVAILGFRRLAQFSTICVPWIFVMFFGGAVFMIPVLREAVPDLKSVGSVSDLWRLASEVVWVGGGESAQGFWHVAAFAWICNLIAHVGLSDMALLRYAPHYGYGLFSALAMYLGHFFAWICAGAMGAASALLLKTTILNLDAGEVAFQSLGLSGIVCVILAGWATSNPSLYRAGLAIQTVTPGWPRWFVTLLAGAFTTIVACFPFVFTSLLEFVALCGVLLVPVGAIVFVEHWVFPRLGLLQYWISRRNRSLNVPALLSWIAGVAVASLVVATGLADLFFVAMPVWVLTGVLYTLLAAGMGARDATVRRPEARQENQVRPSLRTHRHSRSLDSLDIAVGGIAVVSLLACLIIPIWTFLGPQPTYASRLPGAHQTLALASLVHLAAAAVWVLRSEGEAD